MKTFVLRPLLFCLAGATFTSGCAMFSRRSAPTPPSARFASFTPAPMPDATPLDPTFLHRPQTEYRLGPGDELEIEVLGDIDTRARTTVGPDGKIYFYVLPGIDVWGLTMNQTRERIVQELQQYVRDPQPVALTLRSAGSQRIWLLGRVNKPGAYSLAGPMTLLQAVSEAGGPASATSFANLSAGISGGSTATANTHGTDSAADLRRAFVMRQGQRLRVDFDRLLNQGDMSQNIYLEPGDFVYLPSASVGNVHVLGAVNGPRAVEFRNQLTVAQAVAHAGGTLIREAYPSQVAIVRGSLAQPEVAVVDLNAILRGAAPDIALQPQDIVYVPYSPYRVLTRYVDTILDTFVRVVGVNEGARAVSDRATPVGVNVPLGPL